MRIFPLQVCSSARTVSLCLCQHFSWWSFISTREIIKSKESVASKSNSQSWIKIIEATLNILTAWAWLFWCPGTIPVTAVLHLYSDYSCSKPEYSLQQAGVLSPSAQQYVHFMKNTTQAIEQYYNLATINIYTGSDRLLIAPSVNHFTIRITLNYFQLSRW